MKNTIFLYLPKLIIDLFTLPVYCILLHFAIELLLIFLYSPCIKNGVHCFLLHFHCNSIANSLLFLCHFHNSVPLKSLCVIPCSPCLRGQFYFTNSSANPFTFTPSKLPELIISKLVFFQSISFKDSIMLAESVHTSISPPK